MKKKQKTIYIIFIRDGRKIEQNAPFNANSKMS